LAEDGRWIQSREIYTLCRGTFILFGSHEMISEAPPGWAVYFSNMLYHPKCYVDIVNVHLVTKQLYRDRNKISGES